jgi:hypothetical protein
VESLFHIKYQIKFHKAKAMEPSPEHPFVLLRSHDLTSIAVQLIDSDERERVYLSCANIFKF